jgi:hypothetical protein
MEIEGCGKFEYKGHEVSFSTTGRYSGACRNPVAVFAGYVSAANKIVGEFDTVQDAIQWIDGDDSITDYQGNVVERIGGEDTIEQMRRHVDSMPTRSAVDIFREFPDSFRCANALLEYAKRLEGMLTQKK